MQLLLLDEPELLSLEDHPLAWMISKKGFRKGVKACVASGYQKYEKIPDATKCAAGGVRRYGWITDDLYDMYKDEFGGTARPVGNQARIHVIGPDGQYAQIIARKGWLDEVKGGFNFSARAGRQTQNLSLIGEDIPLDPSWGVKIGLLIAHCPDLDDEKLIHVWITHRWRARKGSKFALCQEAVYLGTIGIERKPRKRREATGDTVEL